VPHLEKRATLVKMRHTYKNVSRLKSGPPLEKCATLKNAPRFEKFVIIGKMWSTWKNASQFEKNRVTLGKICHTWKNSPHLEKWVKMSKIGSHVENDKNVSHLKKCTALVKMCHYS